MVLISQAFVEDYVEFKLKIADLDRRLASIICQAFDDCSGVESAFKVNTAPLKTGYRTLAPLIIKLLLHLSYICWSVLVH